MILSSLIIFFFDFKSRRGGIHRGYEVENLRFLDGLLPFLHRVHGGAGQHGDKSQPKPLKRSLFCSGIEERSTEPLRTLLWPSKYAGSRTSAAASRPLFTPQKTLYSAKTNRITLSDGSSFQTVARARSFCDFFKSILTNRRLKKEVGLKIISGEFFKGFLWLRVTPVLI